MTRKPPLCFRTIGPSTLHVTSPEGGLRFDGHAPEPRPCIGSRCSSWVTVGADAPLVCLDAAGNPNYDYGDPRPDAYGVCGHNLRAVPWPDPAGGEG